MGDVERHIITPMEALYGKLDTDDADMVLDAYVTALHTFSNDTLKAAFAEVSRTFFPSKRNPLPMPAHFAKAAASITAGTGKQATEEARREWMKVHDDDLKAAKEFIIQSDSSLVVMALRDGWGRSLRDVARGTIRLFREKHGRRPTMREMLSFRLPNDDVEYYAKFGQQFTDIDLDVILSERAKLGLNDSQRGKMQAAGDGA